MIMYSSTILGVAAMLSTPFISVANASSLTTRALGSNTTACDMVLRVPEPGMLHCGAYGTITPQNAAIIGNLTATGTGADACAAACKTTRQCLVFGYASSNQTCTFYSKNLVDMYTSFSLTPTPMQYYNKQCYIQSCVSSANILDAGDFEDGSWGNWQLGNANTFAGSSYNVTSPGQTGQYAGIVSIVPSQNTGNPVGLIDLSYPSFAVKEGVRYKFQMEYMSDNPLQCYTVVANSESTIFTLGGPGQSITQGNWAPFFATFVAHEKNETITLNSVCEGGSGNLYFDNIQLNPTGSTVYTPASPPTGSNIVNDPNFDSGDLSAYTTSSYNGDIEIVSPGYAGSNYSAAINITGTDDPSGQSYINLQQPVPATINTAVYLVSLAYKSSTVIPAACNIQMQMTNAVGAARSVTILQPGIKATVAKVGSWGQAAGVLAAPGGNVQFIVSMGCQGNSSMNLEVGELSVVQIS